MSTDTRIERLLADALAHSAPAAAPAELVPDILDAASRTRRRPRWLALATERPLRVHGDVLVGSPTARVAYALLLALLLALLAVATLVAGGIIPRPTDLPVTIPKPAPSAVATLPTNRPAHNGMIAVVKDGALVLIDPITGKVAKTLVNSPPNAGTEPVRYPAINPSWAPDGRRLAFEAPDGIWVMGVSDGTSQRILSCGVDADACSVAWSPDGSQLAVVHAGQLELIDPDGTNRTTVLAKEGLWQPTWSPDGSRIAFHGSVPGTAVEFAQGLYVVDRDGSDPTLLLGPLAGIGAAEPAWSPDGSTIAYIGSTDRRTCSGLSKASGCSDDWQLHVMVLTLDWAQPRELLKAGTCVCLGFSPGLTWSPDGRSLALVIPSGDESPWGLEIVDADGTGRRSVVEGAWGHPAWQPVP
jgi:WD40-like Beta Propeller Repeat